MKAVAAGQLRRLHRQQFYVTVQTALPVIWATVRVGRGAKPDQGGTDKSFNSDDSGVCTLAVAHYGKKRGHAVVYKISEPDRSVGFVQDRITQSSQHFRYTVYESRVFPWHCDTQSRCFRARKENASARRAA
jgi:hypothetical protein